MNRKKAGKMHIFVLVFKLKLAEKKSEKNISLE